jgi:hypothetical protein
MTTDRLWTWYSRGLLGVIGLTQQLADASPEPAPPAAIAELQEARKQIDTILRQQTQKRSPASLTTDF